MTTPPLFTKISLNPTSFEIDSDVVVIGHFHNAIEGAIRWSLAREEGKISSLSKDDMCLHIEPGNWNIMHLVDEDDKYVYGAMIWHESLYLDIETITKRSANLKSSLLHEVEIDIERMLKDKLTTQFIGRYGWGSSRSMNRNQDKEFIEQYATSDFQQNDILLSYQNEYLLPNCHCFFVPPREFLSQFVPSARRILEDSWKKVQNIDNDLRLIYQAQNYKKAFDVINICTQKWGEEYQYLLDESRMYWETGKKLKKNSPRYREWVLTKECYQKSWCNTLLECAANQQLNECEIGFCKSEGVVCSWPGVDHMGAQMFFDSIGETPRAKALFLYDA